MAQRRMFNKIITNSDDFLDMPLSSQALYFHLSMNADDDGFVNSPKTTIRMTGASADDYKILVAKNYILEFESGVIVIRHWRLNNYLQKDRTTATNYKNEKSTLMLDENNVYKMYTNCIQNVYTDKIRLDKNRLDKNNIYTSTSLDVNDESPKNKIDYQSYIDSFNKITKEVPKVKLLSENRKRAIKTFAKTFSIDDWNKVCNLINESDFLSGRTDSKWNATFDWCINVKNATKILEENYKNKKDWLDGLLENE